MYWLLLIILIPYLYLLLKIYFTLSEAASFIAEKKPEIFTSLVIACRNEEVNLPLLLKDLSEQDYPDDKYGSSCLIFGHTKTGRPIHVLCSYPSRTLLKIITIYEPDPAEWINCRIRKNKIGGLP